MGTRQEQIELILDHFENPRHYGPMPDSDAVMKGVNPGCGDVVTLYLRLDGDDRLAALSFEGQGCTISQAAASILAEKVSGRRLSEIEILAHDAFVEEMGEDIVVNRQRCATLALSTLKAAIRRLRAGQAPRSAAEAEVEVFA